MHKKATNITQDKRTPFQPNFKHLIKREREREREDEEEEIT